LQGEAEWFEIAFTTVKVVVAKGEVIFLIWFKFTFSFKGYLSQENMQQGLTV